jgi:sulfate permease, SulP family
VVVDAETMPFVDVTAAEMLRALGEDLDRRGIELRIARDIGQVRDILRDEGESGRLYPTVEAAVTQAR